MFTLVRHAAYTTGANPDYEQAVEPTEVTHTQSYLVRKAGGLLLATLPEAEAAALAANRTPAGGIPHAPGYFANLRVSGGEVYIPPEQPGTLR